MRLMTSISWQETAETLTTRRVGWQGRPKSTFQSMRDEPRLSAAAIRDIREVLCEADRKKQPPRQAHAQDTTQPECLLFAISTVSDIVHHQGQTFSWPAALFPVSHYSPHGISVYSIVSYPHTRMTEGSMYLLFVPTLIFSRRTPPITKHFPSSLYRGGWCME